MKKGIKILTPILVTLAMIVSMVGMALPVAADFDPADSNANSINLDLIRPNLHYHEGDTIHFVVIVSTPVAIPAINFFPGKNTAIETTFTRPDGVVVNLPVIAEQNRGEMTVFTEADDPGLAYVVDLADADLNGVVNALANVLAISHCSVTGPAPGGNEYASNFREISTQIFQPSTAVSISTSAAVVVAGGMVNLTVTETNDSDPPEPLETPYVDLQPLGLTLNAASPYYVSGDTNVNGDLDGGETWMWVVTDVVVNSFTTFTATGHAWDPDPGDDITFPGDQEELDSVDVDVIIPDIDIEKTVDCNDDGIFLDEDYGYAGDTGHWKVIVTNTGEVDLTNVTVTDSNGHDFGAPFDLAAGAFVEFNYDTLVLVDTTNIAEVVGTDVLGGTVSDIDAATNLVISPDIDIEKTVDCNDDGIFLDEDMGYAGDTGHWKVIVTNTGDSDLTNVTVTDSNGHDFGAPFDLAAGAFVEFNYDTLVLVDTTNIAEVVGTDVLGGTVSDIDAATNLVINPDTITSITSSAVTVASGDTVDLTVTEENNGDVDLTDPYVEVTQEGALIATLIAPPDLGDDGDGVLEVGEIWQWTITSDPITVNPTTFVATGFGTDPLGGIVTYPAYPGEQDEVPVEVAGNEGCTPGFWKANATNWEAVAWVGYDPDDSFSSVFGVVIEVRTGGKKSNTVVDPTLLQALEANGSGINLLARAATAALLNASNPNINYAMSEAQIIAAVQAAIDAGDEAIQTLGSQLDEYNNAGCTINQQGLPAIPDDEVSFAIED